MGGDDGKGMAEGLDEYINYGESSYYRGRDYASKGVQVDVTYHLDIFQRKTGKSMQRKL